MRNNKLKIVVGVVVLLAVGVPWLFKHKQGKANGEAVKEVRPVIGNIQSFISTTGTVLPKNRLEIKSPVNGRIETVLVREGQQVKTGEILAWMSSTERAALLDAARGKGKEVLEYWQETYKPIPLLAPIDAEVIVATIQPGQTVTTADAVVVLSDRLIVRAQVDETDIGQITRGQEAVIALDAYPDTKIQAAVDHLYYESRTVNNVTIYEVDLLAGEIPAFFRSGMNATVDFKNPGKENVLVIPSEAVLQEGGETVVWVKAQKGKSPVKRPVKLGASDDKNTEVLSGLDIQDQVVVKTKNFVLPKSNMGSNPFMPGGRKKDSSGGR